MKKTILILALATLLAAVFPVTAYAHGGHCGGGYGGNYSGGYGRFALCPLDECGIYGPHEHGGAWYTSQSGINWNNYGACPVDGCAELGLHSHDGSWYHCANYPGGALNRSVVGSGTRIRYRH